MLPRYAIRRSPPAFERSYADAARLPLRYASRYPLIGCQPPVEAQRAAEAMAAAHERWLS